MNGGGDGQRPRRDDVLPRSLPPLGLSRTQAAAYIGVSPSLFDEMVADGRMPPAKRINSRTVWSRERLTDAFADLPGDEDYNSWDDSFDEDQPAGTHGNH